MKPKLTNEVFDRRVQARRLADRARQARRTERAARCARVAQVEYTDVELQFLIDLRWLAEDKADDSRAIGRAIAAMLSSSARR